MENAKRTRKKVMQRVSDAVIFREQMSCAMEKMMRLMTRRLARRKKGWNLKFGSDLGVCSREGF